MIDEIIGFLSPDVASYYNGVTLFILLAVMGLFVGFIASLFGVGGGFLLVPLMNIGLGIPIELASGSATCYIIGTSSTGFIKQLKNKKVEPKVFLFISFGSSIGAVLGDLIQNILLEAVAKGNSLYFERVMLMLFFLLLIVISYIMLFLPCSNHRKTVFLQNIHIGPKIDLDISGIKSVNLITLILIGVSGGILTGLLGVSGGVLFVPILVLAVGLTPHLATGTSLGIVMVSSISAVIKKGSSNSGKISLTIALSLLVASAIGVQVGIWLGKKIPAKNLKRYFGFTVIVAALLVLFKLVKSL